MEDSSLRTDRFRQGARLPALIAVMITGFLVLVAVAVLYGPGFGSNPSDGIFAGLAAVVLLALLAAALWLLHRRPVVLEIGPDGVYLPLTWRHALRWQDIHAVHRFRSRKHLLEEMQWLKLSLAPGVVPDYRLPGPRWLETWYLRRYGLRIPISALGADPDAVVASIERFRPVVRAFT